MKPILEIRNVGKRYKLRHLPGGYLSMRERLTSMFSEKETIEEFWALRDLSFEVMPGDTVGIVGKNGAGKSTLLKILSKITPPSKGSVVLRGRLASLLEVGTGFHPELSGRENVFLNGSLLGMRRSEIVKKFDEIVDFSGTAKFLDTPLKHFSSGMQLRLAFSVAAFLDPEILVIDEVLAVGDVEFQKKCMDKMTEVATQGRTILFVSHNLAALEHLCSKGILLDQGRLRSTGNVRHVINEYLTAYGSSFGDDGEIVELTKEVTLKNFKFDSTEIRPFDDLNYTFRIESSTINRITDLSLLFYNQVGDRVAILDLRHDDLWDISNRENTITVTGKISGIPFIEGNYSIGLYIVSSLCSGDYFNLKRLSVNPNEGKFVPYAAKYRGSIELKNEFTIGCDEAFN